MPSCHAVDQCCIPIISQLNNNNKNIAIDFCSLYSERSLLTVNDPQKPEEVSMLSKESAGRGKVRGTDRLS